MKIKLLMLVVISVFVFSIHSEAKEKKLKAIAEIQNTKGNKIGTARFVEKENGVELYLSVSSLAPGEHGIHIHEVGKCDLPDFKSAGGHFNPFKKKHGVRNTEGAHGGDLPNLVVDKDGKAKEKFVLTEATLKDNPIGGNSLFHPAGTSLVIHAKADDEKTDPSGNSGDRVACGVITAFQK